MKTVSKSILKAKMLEYFRLVQETKEELIVTDNNNPVIKIVPIIQKKNPQEEFKNYQKKVKYSEDILTNTEQEWEET